MTNNKNGAGKQPAIAVGLDDARKELDLVLGFFQRVDAKLSVVLGIDLGMLGLLSSKAPQMSEITGTTWCLVALFLMLCGLSLFQLYRGSFPNLDGGQSSLVFFREIAKRREVEFVDAFTALTADALTKDILCQVWRNSEILVKKFDNLKRAYICMALSVPPWVVALIYFVRAGARDAG